MAAPKELKQWTLDEPVRTLDPYEIKELKKSNLHPSYNPNAEKEIEDFAFWIMDNVYADYNFKGVAQIELIKLAAATFQKTYGREPVAEETEKN